MTWDANLIEEQRRAASHEEGHARLLAGPGTGKTRVLTRRVLYLLTEAGVEPDAVAALTFTRAAAFELRSRIKEALGEQDEYPYVNTLHAFALRNLQFNSGRLEVLPQPVRIADDWEERHVVYEDIKDALEDANITDVRDHFDDMETDYSNLVHGTPAAGADPTFIGAWQEHRETYGYTLRSELVYQLNRALAQVGDFRLSPEPQFLLVDEFQDLNACDISVIQAISQRGVDVYAAGDDDQSIYGFRNANPAGIRNYGTYFEPFEHLPLEICHRCARSIIDLGEFIADLDRNREEKDFRPRDDAVEGEVRLLRFSDQDVEARAIAWLCRYLISEEGLAPSDILILIRSDDQQVFSSLIANALREHEGLPASIDSGSGLPIDTEVGREVMAVLRLVVDETDSLAWRSVFQIHAGNGIGYGSIGHFNEFARARGLRFAEAIQRAVDEDELTAHLERVLPEELDRVRAMIAEVHDRCGTGLADADEDGNDGVTVEDFIERLENALAAAFPDVEEEELEPVIEFLRISARQSEAGSVSQLVGGLSAYGATPEQALVDNAINILTMHKAKGLTAPAVIVGAAEDEYIPGRNERVPERDDERRLLYVSLTRAKTHLYVTYCDTRTNNQQYRGRQNPQARISRTLTRFLRDQDRVPARDGVDYLCELALQD